MNFLNVNWFEVAALVMSVEQGVEAVKNAVGVNAKAAAVGALAETVVSGAEKISGKALVNDPKFAALVTDVISAIADAQNVKIKPTA